MPSSRMPSHSPHSADAHSTSPSAVWENIQSADAQGTSPSVDCGAVSICRRSGCCERRQIEDAGLFESQGGGQRQMIATFDGEGPHVGGIQPRREQYMVKNDARPRQP